MGDLVACYDNLYNTSMIRQQLIRQYEFLNKIANIRVTVEDPIIIILRKLVHIG